MVNIYIVRHGEYENNLSKKCNKNPLIIKHLNDNGIHQAREAREQLKDIEFDRVIVSEFARTKETAKEISDLSQEVREEIKELQIGEEDMSYEEHDNRVKRQIIEKFIEEGDEDIQERVETLKEFLEEIRNEGNKNILIVTHKDIMRLIKIINDNLELNEFYNIHFQNCEVYQI